MGNKCKSMADSCQCMTKPLQYCKVISLQLIKINEKKIKIKDNSWGEKNVFTTNFYHVFLEISLLVEE